MESFQVWGCLLDNLSLVHFSFFFALSSNVVYLCYVLSSISINRICTYCVHNCFQLCFDGKYYQLGLIIIIIITTIFRCAH